MSKPEADNGQDPETLPTRFDKKGKIISEQEYQRRKVRDARSTERRSKLLKSALTLEYGHEPLKATREDIDAVLQQICEGDSLEVACRARRLNYFQTYQKLINNPELKLLYDEARMHRATVHAERCIEMADELAHIKGQNAAERRAEIAAMEVRLKSRQWYAERLAHAVYAPRQKTEVSGNLSLAKLSDEQLREQIAAARAEVEQLSAAPKEIAKEIAKP